MTTAPRWNGALSFKDKKHLPGEIFRRDLLSNSARHSNAGETPVQIAKYREIARRYRRRSETTFLPRLRIAELERIFVMVYRGNRPPDDDAGRADLRLVADHLAQIDPRLIRPWAAKWMPAITRAGLASVGTG